MSETIAIGIVEAVFLLLGIVLIGWLALAVLGTIMISVLRPIWWLMEKIPPHPKATTYAVPSGWTTTDDEQLRAFTSSRP